jgi:hypothetical protein
MKTHHTRAAACNEATPPLTRQPRAPLRHLRGPGRYHRGEASGGGGPWEEIRADGAVKPIVIRVCIGYVWGFSTHILTRNPAQGEGTVPTLEH